MNVKVSIPVTYGGYTGQYEAWEEFTRDFEVRKADDSRVILESTGAFNVRKIVLDMNELRAALEFERQLQPDAEKA